MPLADNWGAETSPSGYELQYAAEVQQSNPSLADAIRSGANLVAALQQAANSYTVNEIERQRLLAQLERARAGLPPISTRGNPSPGSQVPWGVLGAVAAGVGLLFVVSRGSRR